MKRFIAIPLMILYLISISGTMVQLHFCNQKVSSWAINTVTAEDDCCETTEIESCHTENVFKYEDQSCCSDQTVIVKTIADQISPPNFKAVFFATPAIVPTRILIPEFELPHNLSANVVFNANAPPGLWQQIPLFKLHKRFTYYG